MQLNLYVTIVFEKNLQALNGDKRFIVNQGSSRSSKTWSLCQLMVVYALMNRNKTVSIVRKSFPTLRATVMRDFFEVMKVLGVYDRRCHNKTENIYTFPNGSVVEFFSTDDEQKLRGRKRDVCWANEANELLHDDFLQLNMRTAEKIIVDYNPSDADCWIYDLAIDDKIIIKSTYKDNPFVPDSIVKQLEDLKNTDEALYQIYALGERAMSRKNVYDKWTFDSNMPEYFVDYIYGLDFGFNHPTALVKLYYTDTEIYVEKMIYESYLTTPELIERMQMVGIDQVNEIMCDYARPEIIMELRNAGYNTMNANKQVKNGINKVKQYKIICQEDNDILKEYRNYMWKKNGDMITDEPVKLYDDIMDAMRYGIYQISDLYKSGGTPLIMF